MQTLLEGSIRRAGNRVRITAQLIEAEQGGHLWADVHLQIAGGTSEGRPSEVHAEGHRGPWAALDV